MLRGGAFSPHLPYTSQGMGERGLDLLMGGAELDMPVVTEVMDPRDVAMFVEKGVDVLQSGPATPRTSPASLRWAAPGRPCCSSAACPRP